MKTAEDMKKEAEAMLAEAKRLEELEQTSFADQLKATTQTRIQEKLEELQESGEKENALSRRMNENFREAFDGKIVGDGVTLSVGKEETKYRPVSGTISLSSIAQDLSELNRNRLQEVLLGWRLFKNDLRRYREDVRAGRYVEAPVVVPESIVKFVQELKEAVTVEFDGVEFDDHTKDVTSMSTFIASEPAEIRGTALVPHVRCLTDLTLTFADGSTHIVTLYPRDAASDRPKWESPAISGDFRGRGAKRILEQIRDSYVPKILRQRKEQARLDALKDFNDGVAEQLTETTGYYVSFVTEYSGRGNRYTSRRLLAKSGDTEVRWNAKDDQAFPTKEKPFAVRAEFTVRSEQQLREVLALLKTFQED